MTWLVSYFPVMELRLSLAFVGTRIRVRWWLGWTFIRCYPLWRMLGPAGASRLVYLLHFVVPTVWFTAGLISFVASRVVLRVVARIAIKFYEILIYCFVVVPIVASLELSWKWSIRCLRCDILVASRCRKLVLSVVPGWRCIDSRRLAC